MALTTEQKIDRLRQSLYLFTQKHNGKCRPFKDVYIVYYKDSLYVCDLINRVESVWNNLMSYGHDFIDYLIGFENNDIVAMYILDKCNVN